MKRSIFFILGGVVGIVAVALLMGLSPGKQQPLPREYAQAGAARSLEEQTKSEGQVAITVTPAFAGTWRFAISLETHSVELSQALEQVSTLIDDRGKEYAPLSWEGDPPGGHHRSGTLVLDGDIDPLASSLTLTIRDIGGIPSRQFTWTLK